MKLIIETAHDLISNMRSFFQVNTSEPNYTSEEPLRDELFSADQMSLYGQKLAKTHILSKNPVNGQLLKRLADNEKVLNAVRKLLVDAIKANSTITPAGEWLIDNFYLIEEQIRTARNHLPLGYSKTLPQLLNANAASPGLTRVYNIALQIISHSDGRIDEDSLGHFLNSYQSVSPLQLGELWAIPIMLRLTLIENLRRISSMIAIDRIDKNLADHWVEQILAIAEQDPKNVILATGDMARSAPPMTGTFVSEMNRQLLGKGPALTLTLNWIEQRLNEDGKTSNEIVNAEIKKQAVNQVSVSNSIGSLRLLSSIDWRDFVETHSNVEQTLRKERSGIYGRMDFSTRDSYRHVVERISKKSELSENDVAKIALQLADENLKKDQTDNKRSHVGYYLVGKGVSQTKNLAGMHISFAESTRNTINNHRLLIYLGSILSITIAISTSLLLKASVDVTHNWVLIPFGIFLALAVSQFAIAVINFFSTLFVEPHLLPRMDFSAAIPKNCSTLIVVPAMLTNRLSIEALVEALEVRFLANRDENLYFGLLTDFTDAAQETLPGDASLLQLAEKRINELNEKYKAGRRDVFCLFHRPRQWNAGEKTWMGYERKRGKLGELNSLLRGNSKDRFSCIIGDLSVLQQVKYVITLDSDTQMPRGTAWKMIATLAHPLNQAIYNEKKKRVTEGYGILQPRVTVSLPESNSSFYSRLHGNEPGVDPYTRATSDVYQDLFCEGSFIGKGIYDIDIFEKTLKGRFIENRILSHDLLEGCYVRSGLLSDVELFEKYPMSYRTDMKRRSRWLRGDWQILLWFLPFVPGADRRIEKNPISALSSWKIFDNIRRSLVPIALTLLVILGWTVSANPLFWTIMVSGIIVFPIFVTLFWDAIKKPANILLSHHINTLLHTTGNTIVQTLFTLACLPYEAFVSVVAIVRTIWRMIISHRNLLEWDPSIKADSVGKNSLTAYYSKMWIALFLTFSILIYLSISAPFRIIIAGPILFLWAWSPFIVWLASKPPPRQKSLLTDKQNIFLFKIARKTWGFFERFVSIEDNWLPPDNFQQYPVAAIAHRTSPTNIGLSLLANLAAHDFGYLSTGQFLERTSGTIATMKKMERYRGHFYNWYDTESLKPLLPKYISTVDSGNLAGHLLTLRQGVFEIIHQKIAGSRIFYGLLDTLRVFKETLGEDDTSILVEFTTFLETECSKSHSTWNSIRDGLNRLVECYESTIKNLDTEAGSITEWWKERLSKQIDQIANDFQILSPWLLFSPAPDKFATAINIDRDITLGHLFKKTKSLIPELSALKGSDCTTEENEWLDKFINALGTSQQLAKSRIALIEKIGHECIDLADMEMDFLYDKSKRLLTIGYRVEDHVRDSSYYDLLASEARLCTFVGIAQGKLPEESWFALGRQLTNIGHGPALLSWGGSMFEYLMPLLVMPTYENTLLDQTYKSSVKTQVDYGKQRGTPWGVSESGYNMVDASSNYQYQTFGVPGLGLKRGLEADLVIAPYATALSLMVAPEVSCQNLELLVKDGFEGAYGFYEAIDYTASRLQRGQANTVIQSFMAHHEGMTLLSIEYLLLGQPMQRRFEAEPQFQATLLLLQERIPKTSSFFAHTTDLADFSYPVSGTKVRIINTPDTPIPEVQLLSNGRYHVMVTNSGGGYSRWKDLAITRWHEDVTCDNWGTFCYIRDIDSGEYWSNTHQPTRKKAKIYEAGFSQGRADFYNCQNKIDTHTEMVISPEDDVEIRRMRITNKSAVQRTIEITSYAEIVLAPPISDAMQPAFSNLFVQTEILPHHHAIICSRRPRSTDEHTPSMFHSLIIHGTRKVETSYETDRMEFIGHGNTVANPRVMDVLGPLSGSEGSVLDPIVAIRYKVVLEPEESLTMDLIIGVGETREVCEKLIEKYQDKHHKDRVFELAWTHSQVILRQINVTEHDEQLFGSLAGSVIFANRSLRAAPSIIIKNHRGQSGLWGYSVSGDLPIILLQIEDQSNVELAKQIIQAHTYWRHKGLISDLVIWNEDKSGYRQTLQNQILGLIPNELIDRPGGVFVRAADQISNEDRILFQSVARISMSDLNGTLADHINHNTYPKSKIPFIPQTLSYIPETASIPIPENLLFFNGSGGFSPEGNEYIIITDKEHRTPTPWANVIANPDFGTVISESGQAYTWTENAHEMRLTPWHNDIVTDAAGEIFYLRDEETGHFWTATPLPAGGESPYVTRHGFGYSVFEHIEDGIRSEMSVYVDLESPVKFTVLKVRNDSDRARRLSATGYIEWVLGDLRPKTAMHIVTQIDTDNGAFFAKNPYSTEFSDRLAFFDVDDPVKTFTGDRTEFIGRNGSLQNPDAMHRMKLSGNIGVALDPCAAIQVPFDLAVGEEREIIFRLGAGKNLNSAWKTVNKFRGAESAHLALEKVVDYWKQTTSALRVETPDASLNMITNGWLTYQTLSCRLWGRSGYYQSGGAFGFRDQLQDVLSLLHARPELAKKQILLCATHQFQEGDVQHWWHPPSGRGVRTRISDDFLWLPFVTCRYVLHTGDVKILDESLHFIEGRTLNPGEESYYELPAQSVFSATLYNHCVKAIKHGLSYGQHGLPLMGAGDWNDGMNRVGPEGVGESVWLAFFLYDVLTKFIDIANLHNDPAFAEECRKEADTLNENIEKNGWDGKWYRRAWFDDGTPLGSSVNVECKIDSIPQSWSVLSGAGNEKNRMTAMESAEQRLVKKDERIIQLLDPPFDKAPTDPGYIKGYVPGIRENGGQYTHAAVWMVMAFAKMGDSNRTWELLQMINPLNHGRTPEEIAVYKVEPYVTAGDVYAVAPHAGRGGWTWYTGSAGWMYQLIIESFLGLQTHGDKLRFKPCIPAEWESFKMHYRYRDTMYHITVQQKNTDGSMIVTADGVTQEDNALTLVDDKAAHFVEVLIFNGTDDRSSTDYPIETK